MNNIPKRRVRQFTGFPRINLDMRPAKCIRCQQNPVSVTAKRVN